MLHFNQTYTFSFAFHESVFPPNAKCPELVQNGLVESTEQSFPLKLLFWYICAAANLILPMNIFSAKVVNVLRYLGWFASSKIRISAWPCITFPSKFRVWNVLGAAICSASPFSLSWFFLQHNHITAYGAKIKAYGVDLLNINWPPGGKRQLSRAAESESRAWRESPRVWTFPWLGSLCSYTTDPLGFIQKNHNKHGDVFTTTILGYKCTFLRSNAYIRTFTTATRKVLDVTAAYKLVAAPLIGKEAFFGQTKYMNQVVLSKQRIEQLHDRLWELTDELIERKWAQCLAETRGSGRCADWHQVDLGQMLDYVVFGLDVFVLIGEQMLKTDLDRISHLFRVMDSDLSLAGILKPMIRGGRCPRKEAKEELLGFLQRDVKKRVQRHVQNAVHAEYEAFEVGDPDWSKYCLGTEYLDTEFGSKSCPELPEILLQSELKDLDDSVLLDYHRGDEAAIQAINSKVEFIAIFIYGFVWAAQTNSAAATIGLVHDIIYHEALEDDPRLSGKERPSSHVDIIRKECSLALSNEGAQRATLYENMPHLTRCLNETIRLRATGAWIRLADKPFMLPPQRAAKTPGVICPKGFIVLSPVSVSLNPTTYLDPNAWDPTRYERAPFMSTESESKKDSSRYIPLDKTYLIPPATPTAPYFASWGLGQGHCPGKHLAYKMITMTVARFFDKFDVRPLGPSAQFANFQDIAAAGVQRLKGSFRVEIRKRPT